VGNGGGGIAGVEPSGTWCGCFGAGLAHAIGMHVLFLFSFQKFLLHLKIFLLLFAISCILLYFFLTSYILFHGMAVCRPYFYSFHDYFF